ncbi:hypothetical protein ACTFIU_006600 [Dictyostelium citrinum]
MPSREFIIPLILLCFYSVNGIVAVVSSLVELFIHKASWNSIKIFFYSLLILQCLCRCIIIGWGMIETVQGGEFYSNFPSLLFISYAGLIALQMIQFLPNDNQYLLLSSEGKKNNHKVKVGTNILIFFNLFMYFGMFLLFGIAEKQIGNSTSFNHHGNHNSTIDNSSITSTDEIPIISTEAGELYLFGDKDPIYIVLDCFYFVCLITLLAFHSYVGWKTYKRNKDLFGIKLNVIHLILLICIFIRSLLVIFDPSSPNNSILHIDTESWLIYIYTLSYYVVGEIIPGMLLIVIEFLLPYHKRKDFINIGGELSSYQDVWKSENIAIHELLGMGGSGAMVHRCTVKKGPLRGGTFAVKVMKDCTNEDIESLENEIRVYEKLKSPYIVSYQGSSKVVGSNGHIFEIRLFMEYIPHTLDKYLLARSVCGDSNGGGSSRNLKNYFLHMQEYQSSPQSSFSYYQNQNQNNNQNNSLQQQQQQQQQYIYPYYFRYSQVVWYLYQISIGLDNLHANKIAHRDLKSNNIFVTLSESEIKICKIGDFDISRSFNNPKVLNVLSNPTALQQQKLNGFFQSEPIIESSITTTTTETPQTIHSAFQHDILSFGFIVLDFLTLSNYSCLDSKFDTTNHYYDDKLNNNKSSVKIKKPDLPDYIKKEEKLWEPIIELYKSCTSDDPNKRPSSLGVKFHLSNLYKDIIESGTEVWSIEKDSSNK